MAHDIRISPSVLRKKNQTGFVLVGTLLLVGTVLSSLLFAFYFQSIVRKNSELKSECVNLNIKFQNKQKRSLQKLLSLNPRSRLLRRDLALAKKRLQKALMTGTPPVIAAAEAQVLFVEARRFAHDGKQKLILAQSATEERSFYSELNRNLGKSFRRRASIKIEVRRLAVEPDIRYEMAPVYLTKDDFMNEQKSSALWQTTSENLLPVPIVFVNQKLVQLPLRQKWENSCAVTLEERRPGQFFVSMIAAK